MLVHLSWKAFVHFVHLSDISPLNAISGSSSGNVTPRDNSKSSFQVLALKLLKKLLSEAISAHLPCYILWMWADKSGVQMCHAYFQLDHVVHGENLQEVKNKSAGS